MGDCDAPAAPLRRWVAHRVRSYKSGSHELLQRCNTLYRGLGDLAQTTSKVSNVSVDCSAASGLRSSHVAVYCASTHVPAPGPHRVRVAVRRCHHPRHHHHHDHYYHQVGVELRARISF